MYPEQDSPFEYGDPYIEWNEENEANDDGRAVAEAERADAEDEDESVCADGYPEHVENVTYDGPDGTQWECRRCGAEGWEAPEGEAK